MKSFTNVKFLYQSTQFKIGVGLVDYSVLHLRSSVFPSPFPNTTIVVLLRLKICSGHYSTSCDISFDCKQIWSLGNIVSKMMPDMVIWPNKYTQ